MRWDTYDAVGHQGSLGKACQDVSGVVLVVRDTGQAGVERHHDEGELGERPEETGTAPGEPRLEVELGGVGERGRMNTKGLVQAGVCVCV